MLLRLPIVLISYALGVLDLFIRLTAFLTGQSYEDVLSKLQGDGNGDE